MVKGAVVGVQGALKGKQFTLSTQPITFGRSDDNDVVLPSESASRAHAVLRQQDGAFILEDRGSSNGTWINGTRVNTPQQLYSGDEIMMGDQVFRFATSGSGSTLLMSPLANLSGERLRVLVTGGGPVGLSFCLAS